MTIPILEFDPTPQALIEPSKVIQPLADMPEHVVLCFFQEAIQHWREQGRLQVIGQLGSEIGKNPIYRLNHERGAVAIVHPGVGAPLAVGFLEETIAKGGRKFIACGGAGALTEGVHLGHVVVPENAIRDEGTSYHYLPPEALANAHLDAVRAIIAILEQHGVPYDLGKTWTTDAIYRETPERIRKRREQGALTVEMEASAFFAVAQFRQVVFGQMLYGGDDVSGDVWDSRGWDNARDIREKLLQMAIEAVLLL
ncbi:MAG: nucleoside phosphorylase [Anaerolineae bacterium]